MTQQEAAKCNLQLNLEKTKHNVYNFEAISLFRNDDSVPWVSSIVFVALLKQQVNQDLRCDAIG